MQCSILNQAAVIIKMLVCLVMRRQVSLLHKAILYTLSCGLLQAALTEIFDWLEETVPWRVVWSCVMMKHGAPSAAHHGQMWMPVSSADSLAFQVQVYHLAILKFT